MRCAVYARFSSDKQDMLSIETQLIMCRREIERQRIHDTGLLDAISAVLVAGIRVADGRETESTACIIDSWPLKITEAGGPRGYDAADKVKRRKRHIATDTAGNLLEALVHSADVQDRNRAPDFFECCWAAYPLPPRVFADGGYTEQKLEAAIALLDRVAIEVIRRLEQDPNGVNR